MERVILRLNNRLGRVDFISKYEREMSTDYCMKCQIIVVYPKNRQVVVHAFAWLESQLYEEACLVDLCLVDGVCWLVSRFWVHQDVGKHHALWWSTRCDRLLEEQKNLLASFSFLHKIVFKIDGFLGLWQDVARNILQPLERGLCWRQRVRKRDLILSGKADSLPRAERAVGQQQPESSGWGT